MENREVEMFGRMVAAGAPSCLLAEGRPEGVARLSRGGKVKKHTASSGDLRPGCESPADRLTSDVPQIHRLALQRRSFEPRRLFGYVRLRGEPLDVCFSFPPLFFFLTLFEKRLCGEAIIKICETAPDGCGDKNALIHSALVLYICIHLDE